MRLNPDCIRDILLTVEENTGYSKFMEYPKSYPLLKPYSDEEVLYHIKQCEMSNLLTKVHYYIGGGCSIQDLTPGGHEFLANIRLDTNWNKTKDIAKTVGSTSLNAITEIASTVITNIIKGQI